MRMSPASPDDRIGGLRPTRHQPASAEGPSLRRTPCAEHKPGNSTQEVCQKAGDSVPADPVGVAERDPRQRERQQLEHPNRHQRRSVSHAQPGPVPAGACKQDQVRADLRNGERRAKRASRKAHNGRGNRRDARHAMPEPAPAIRSGCQHRVAHPQAASRQPVGQRSGECALEERSQTQQRPFHVGGGWPASGREG